MKKLEVLSDKFQKPKDFSIDQFLKGSFGVFSGKSRVEVKICFDAWAARFIRERTWHRTQRIRRLSRGHVELQLTLSSTVEVLPWLLSWGVHARALAPKLLVDEVKEIVKELKHRYQ
jgi:predicted DNA-binding transcriptional regulator YafY